jgi:hypothetical protein
MAESLIYMSVIDFEKAFRLPQSRYNVAYTGEEWCAKETH